MQIVILAGGFGSRLSEETELKPKPMVEIGGKPILWHIMKIYSHYGYNDFIICLGYKGHLIKEYFANYFLKNSDCTIDLAKNSINIHNCHAEEWKVTLVDTGLNTMTGGRIKRIQPYINNETFMLTYGDGVADININELVKFHKKHKKLATLTAIQPTRRFGVVELDDNGNVTSFVEKPQSVNSWVNGGFFVLEPKIFDYIKEDDSVVWEKEPLVTLSEDNQLVGFRHTGFWKPMDTIREKQDLEKMYLDKKAPWVVWKDV
jgi:glucose-1-phosphate cytidylyltransferase